MSRFLVVAGASDQQIAVTIDDARAEPVGASEPCVLVVDGNDACRRGALSGLVVDEATSKEA